MSTVYLALIYQKFKFCNINAWAPQLTRITPHLNFFQFNCIQPQLAEKKKVFSVSLQSSVMLVGSIKPDPNQESLNCPTISKCKKVQVLCSKIDLGSVKQTIASIIWSQRELIGNKGKQVPKGHKGKLSTQRSYPLCILLDWYA